MKIKYIGNMKQARKNVIKFVIIRNGQIGVWSLILLNIILTLKNLFRRKFLVEVELTEDGIIVSSGKIKNLKLKYSQISRIYVDADDIVIINNRVTMVLSSYAFKSDEERAEFINMLEGFYKKSSENPETLDLTNEKERKKFNREILKSIYINRKYTQYKKTLKFNVIKSMRSIILISIWIVLFAMYTVYNMGGLSQNIGNIAATSIIIVTILYITFLYYLPKKIWIKNFSSEINGQVVNLELEIFKDGIIFKENEFKNKYGYDSILKAKLINGNLGIEIINDSKKVERILMPKEAFSSRYEISKTIININRNIKQNQKQEQKFDKINIVLNILVVISIVILFATPSLTSGIIKMFMPNYYKEISNIRNERIIMQNNSKLFDSIRDAANNTVNNNNNIPVNNNNIANSNSSAKNYSPINLGARSNLFNSTMYYGKFNSEYKQTFEQDINNGKINEKYNPFINMLITLNWANQYIADNIGPNALENAKPYSQECFKYLNNAEGDMTSQDMPRAKKAIETAIAYDTLMSEDSPIWNNVGEAIDTEEAAYAMMNKNPKSEDLVYLNAEMPSGGTITNYLVQNGYNTITHDGKEIISGNILVGPLQINKGRLFRGVFVLGQNPKNYKFEDVYENGQVNVIYQA